MSRFLWTQKEDIGPAGRFGHAMAYDSVRSRTSLFGGSLLIGGQSASVNDTWEWNGEFWTQMADIRTWRRYSPGHSRTPIRSVSSSNASAVGSRIPSTPGVSRQTRTSKVRRSYGCATVQRLAKALRGPAMT